VAPCDRRLYGIDAGGSRTAVAVGGGGPGWTGPPVNPSSVGQDASDRGLAELLARIRVHAEAGGPDGPGGPGAGGGRDRARARAAIWLASAAVDQASAAGEARRAAAAAAAAGLRAELLLSNDVTPLLLAGPAGTGHVIAVCGTGSGFLATDGRSGPVRAGGCEYLGSDEGSAFDLGLRGLRAAVRGLDGRGPATALAGLLAASAGEPVTELARHLAGQPYPKSAVAALAPVVLQAWLDADPVAGGLAADAIGELAEGIAAAVTAAALEPGWRLSVTGGVAAGCPEFFRRLAAAAADLGAGPVTLISDPAAAVLAALATLAGTDPIVLADPRIGADVWRLDLAGVG
jgi:N-acetylglucosamine kinase-like BadF-type ATPase